MLKNKSRILEYFIFSVMIVFCTLCLVACGDKNPKFYTVTFMVDGEVYHTETTEWDKSTVFPDEPTKLGYEFDGWFEGDTEVSEINKGYDE